ncbi:MAG TPA: condensation domain-containing protein [Candidatus Acidoferrum sp.]|nr:condensation domain-containing protein [Candidatus Acidoferrum sp.]
MNKFDSIRQPEQLSDAKRLLLQLYSRGSKQDQPASVPAISRRAQGSPPPLGLAQEQIWRHAQRLVDMPLLYNESITIYRTGPLDVDALERSFTEIVRRHDIWRTTYDTLDGQPVQIIHPAPDRISLPVADLRGLPVVGREKEALRLATAEARRPFNMREGPLVRPTLVRLGDEEYRLFLIMHQSIVDGVSAYEVLPSELAALYNAFSAGKPSPLPELPVQYADFASWQREWLQGEELTRQMAYWRNQLAGELPVLQWPNDRPRPASQSYRGAILPFGFSRELTASLRRWSQQEEVTLFMTLLAGFTALLHHYTQQADIVVGTPAPSGRKRSEVQALMGYFLNPLPLRMSVAGNPTFRELLCQAREVTSGAISNDDVPLEYLAKELCLKQDASRHPFFQVAISLAPEASISNSGWDMTAMDVDSGGARWDLYLVLSERPSGMLGRAQYNPDLFEENTISSTIEHFQRLLEVLGSNPALRVSESAFPEEGHSRSRA